MEPFNKWGRLLIDDKMCTTYFPIDFDFTCICQGRLQFLVSILQQQKQTNCLFNHHIGSHSTDGLQDYTIAQSL